VRPCPYCAQTIEDQAPVCPFCKRTLILPPGARGAPPPPLSVPGSSGTSGKAVASLICGIFFFFFPSAILAVIMGHLSLSDIKRSAGALAGRGMAIAGLVLGYAGLAVVPILIIAAIAIPNLLRARMAANEAFAVGCLRSYQYALGEYAAKCPKLGFPRSLGNLGPGRGDCDRAQLLDNSLGTEKPTKAGYVFVYNPGPEENRGQVVGFTLEAHPVVQGTTGVRHFFLDQSGTIHMSSDGPADSSSPSLQ
jgi:type IV pilus assembly protein PilA